MNIGITGRGVKITKGIEDKINDMLSKHKQFLKAANKIEVELKENISHAGVEKDLKVEVTITMPKVLIRVEESGSDFYAIVDEVDPVLRRRLVRYQDRKRLWDGQGSWRVAEREKFQKDLEKVSEDVYADNTDIPPIITRHKEYSQNSPMHPAEAIERMELLGHEAFLFKDIETGRYSMVYKKRDGTYGLVVPRDA
jgi:putative sigma-54 modulation protein